MGNTVSVDTEQPDIWWTPTSVETKIAQHTTENKCYNCEEKRLAYAECVTTDKESYTQKTVQVGLETSTEAKKTDSTIQSSASNGLQYVNQTDNDKTSRETERTDYTETEPLLSADLLCKNQTEKENSETSREANGTVNVERTEESLASVEQRVTKRSIDSTEGSREKNEIDIIRKSSEPSVVNDPQDVNQTDNDNDGSSRETDGTVCTERISETLQSVSQTDEDDYEASRKRRRELKMLQFKSELEKKHLARREAIAERSREILFLREELVKYRKENEELKDMLKENESTHPAADDISNETDYEIQKLKVENSNLQDRVVQLKEDLRRSQEVSQQNLDLRKTIAETQKDLQAVNTQVLEFEKERHDYQSHVVALKDVIRVSKKLLEIREGQLRELQTKVADIETSLAEREVSMLSTNLKDEYERQLENIRALRTLYEQRQAATKAERDLMASQLSDAKNSLEQEQKKNSEMQERVTELEDNVSDKYDQIKSLESQLGLAKAEYRGLQAEMSVINQLFSQILFGFNNCQDVDFDKLIKLLEENHDLLTNIVINEESEAISSALPKVLLDLVNQVNEKNKSAEPTIPDKEEPQKESHSSNDGLLPTIPEENLQIDQQCGSSMNSAEEIVNILPKVWRVLIELLRQQSGQQPVEIQEGPDPCYKSVQTPKGPKLVLSVSQTFIRLKDLILEKKSLEKETCKLKQLNTHLETRLQDQEKRLETVSTELNKTWHVVGRMQRQHQQLHTHEKILRYELAQKRKMLTELKQELEYCREKWEQAREKNSNTEEEWKKLRIEFAARKIAVDELNNSAESGYSDEREGSSDDESSFDNTENRARKLNKVANEINSDNNASEQTSDAEDNELSHRSDTEDANSSPDRRIVSPEDDTSNLEPKTVSSEDISETENATARSDSKEASPGNAISRSDSKEANLEEATSSSDPDVGSREDSTSIEIPGALNDPSVDSNEGEPTVLLHSFLTSETDDEVLQKGEKNSEPMRHITLDNIDTVDALTFSSNINTELSTSPSSSSNHEELPSTSREEPTTSTDKKKLTADELLSRREARLKRLEEQCQQLVTKVVNTTYRSAAIYNRLELLHEQYGNDNTQTNTDDTASDQNETQ